MIPVIIFIISLIPLATAQTLKFRRDAVYSHTEKERTYHGHFTGAKIQLYRLPNGKLVQSPIFPALVVLANILVVPFLLLIHFNII